MKKQVISVIGWGTLANLGCGPIINPNPPPQNTVPAANEQSNALPSWEELKAPKEESKAELIVTEKGCFKNWVDATQTPNDRFEESGIGTEIECPERAKNITKEKKKIPSKPPEPIRENPPPPQR